MGVPSTVERALSDAEREAFLADLAKEPNLTVARIVEMAGERGFKLSASAAQRFRAGAYSDYLARLRKARELASSIEAIQSANPQNTLSDAAGSLLAQLAFEQIAKGGDIDLDLFSKVIARLRSGDARAKELEAKLEVYEREKREWARKAAEQQAAREAAIADVRKAGGITEQTRQKVLNILSGF